MANNNALTSDWKQVRRFHALELKRDGWTHQEIAEALGVTKGAVSQWMTLVKEHGESGLFARPHNGATPKLTTAQINLIPEFLSHGAEAYGFRGDLWTCARIAAVIRQEFSISYHKDHVSRLLKVLRWTPQKPMQRAIQRNEVEIAKWREENWPELKKKPSASAGSWFLLMNRGSTCCQESFALTPLVDRLRCCIPI